jgi:hypothetical protein
MGEAGRWFPIVRWYCCTFRRHYMGESGRGYCGRCGLKYTYAIEED